METNMKEILLVSNNKHKVKEISAVLSPLGFNVVSLAEAGIEMEIEETGITFAENAILKAEALRSYWFGGILADDSGIEFECLNGLPGVYSARFLGEDTPYHLKNKLVLQLMEKQQNRKARYVCCLAFLHQEKTYTFEAYLNGEIANKTQGEYGFGYDPIFYLPARQCNLAELTPDEKNLISHRSQATKMLAEFLEESSHEE